MQVSGLGGGVSTIAAGGGHAGGGHTCAVLVSGAAKCWGSNARGAVGDGTTTDSPAPVQVSGLGSGVSIIDAGLGHTCAVLVSGAAKCWGYNGSGELGDGTQSDRLTPVQVAGLGSGVSTIAAGGNHTCAVLASGAAKCWGYNWSGQLGDGTQSDRLTPANVTGLARNSDQVSEPVRPQ